MNATRKAAALGVLVLACLAGLSGQPGSSAPAPRPVATEHRSYTETLPGSKVRFEMIAVPGGTYSMGSPEYEKGRGGDEGPRHTVRVGPFWIGKTEVTWNEFNVFRKKAAQAKSGGQPLLPAGVDAITGPTGPYHDITWGYGEDGYPAIGVTHHAAMEYCRWLSLVTGKVYRLPTEAEWEYACRAGGRTAYPWGNDAARLKEHAWYDDNSLESPHPVGKKKPNRWGLFDMLGNVAEWCLDHYDRDFYAACAAVPVSDSPVKRPSAMRYPHVVRGGSWADAADRCRSAARRASEWKWNKRDPQRPQSIWWLADADFVGFRVVRAVAEQKELRGIRSQVTPASP